MRIMFTHRFSRGFTPLESPSLQTGAEIDRKFQIPFRQGRVKAPSCLTGFTLVELLVVIAIIGVLSTLAVTSLTAARRHARDAQRMSDVREIQKALELYFGEKNEYPYGSINGQPQAGPLGPPDRTALSEDNGFASTSAGRVFMTRVPASPTPPAVASVPENVYAYAGTDANYVISFYLEAATGGLPAGLNCIDKNGLSNATGSPAACPAP